MLGANIINLGICFNNKEECTANGYYYYNSQDKICWKDSCGSNYKTNEIDDEENKPKEDSAGNTCTKTCYSPFSKLSSDGLFCKTNCDSNEYFKVNGPNSNKCMTDLSGCEGFIGANNECVSICPNYYYEEGSNIKRCVDNCYEIIGKYYYEGDKKCYDNCEIFSNEEGKCLKRCSPNEKIHNKKCLSNCPNTDPYYIEVTINGETANKCVASCVVENTQYIKIIEYNNQCAKSCPPGYLDINDRCYAYCPDGSKFFNPETLTCEGHCPQEKPLFEKLEKDDKYIYICKSLCDGINKYNINGECVFSCKEPYNKIGDGNKCKQSCLSDPNGEFYIQTETEGTTSNTIYKCCTCTSSDAHFFKDKECYEKCPDDTITNGYKCEVKNPNSCSLSVFNLNLTFNDLVKIIYELTDENFQNSQIFQDSISLVLFLNIKYLLVNMTTFPNIKIKNLHHYYVLLYYSI